MTSFSIQLKQHNTPQLTASLSGLHLWHFLSCARKHPFVSSRPPPQKGFDLYPSLRRVAETRWWLSIVTPTSPASESHHPRTRGDTAAAAPPAQLGGTPRGQQVIHKRLFQHPMLWGLNSQTSAGEKENDKFNSSLLIHSTLVIFQLLLVCRGLSIF